MLIIDYLNGRQTADVFGTAKYTYEINKRLTNIHLNYITYPEFGNNRILDGCVKRLIYPFIVRNRIERQRIKHITNQDLAFTLAMMNFHPTIITCYDLIPLTYYRINSLYWKMNLKGLSKADCIITISEFSKKDIIRLTGFSTENIEIIYPGVDLIRYERKKDRSILTGYNIPEQNKVILFVGSEEPRKNISLLIKAFHLLKKDLENITLLKVGGTQMGGDRQSLVTMIRELGLEKDIIFTGQVREEDLPRFYNAADLFVFPSLYEGFGLPPLEAMASGCPVIGSNSTSLPEVIGDAGILIDPHDPHDLALKMYRVLVDTQLGEKLSQKGFERAKLFSWDEAAARTERVYERFS